MWGTLIGDQMSLFNQDDLNLMYSKYKLGGDIILWFEGRCREDSQGNRNRDIETAGTGQQKQEREEQVDDIYKDLKLKHNTIPQLRLWSKIVCSGIHEDTDKPPDILAFGSSVKKKPCRESLADAITGAATTFIKSFGATSDVRRSSESNSGPTTSIKGVPSTGPTTSRLCETLNFLFTGVVLYLELAL